MKQIGLTILTLFLIYSCNTNSAKDNNNQPSISDKSSKDSLTKPIFESDKIEPISNSELLNVFTKAVQFFPNDSGSLKTFYFKWNLAKDQDKINRQIKRLEKLTSKESVDRYRSVENYLKPLMTKIVNSSAISKIQSDSLVILYSDYDYFSGESLLSKLLTNNDNYDLVWKSFRVMVKESKIDTCFISGLIQLDKNIRTNAELAEAMGEFVVNSIQNNPIGFLEMYGSQKAGKRPEFANYIAVWDDPDEGLIQKFTEISKNSTNKNYRQLATELIGQFNN